MDSLYKLFIHYLLNILPLRVFDWQVKPHSLYASSAASPSAVAAVPLFPAVAAVVGSTLPDAAADGLAGLELCLTFGADCGVLSK